MENVKKLWTGVKTQIKKKNGISNIEVLESKWTDFNDWVEKLPVEDTRKANEVFDEMQNLIRS
ncbi:MAG TPA: hypothetical protein VFM82_03660 [Flavobacteriaceae bacterium]|nr:hypothetical protein [Flavobacteriaceae bacterium]